MISYYQTLGEIRKNHAEIFADGEWKEIVTKDGLILFKRVKDNHELYVYANNSNQSYCFEKNGKFIELLKNHSFENSLQLPAYSYGIIKKDE